MARKARTAYAAVIVVAVLLPLLVPAFVASFLYAYRSPQLWANGRRAHSIATGAHEDAAPSRDHD